MVDFVSTGSEYEQAYTLDTLNATESFLISFWNEIAVLDNGNRGGDQEPSFIYRQQATLLCAAISAVWLYLMRLEDEASKRGLNNWSIPFKEWSGKGWPDCYSKDPTSSDESANESPEK